MRQQHINIKSNTLLLLLFLSVDIDFLFPEGGQLFLACFHVRMNCFAGDSQIAHERQDRDFVGVGQGVIALPRR